MYIWWNSELTASKVAPNTLDKLETSHILWSTCETSHAKQVYMHDTDILIDAVKHLFVLLLNILLMLSFHISIF